MAKHFVIGFVFVMGCGTQASLPTESNNSNPTQQPQATGSYYPFSCYFESTGWCVDYLEASKMTKDVCTLPNNTFGKDGKLQTGECTSAGRIGHCTVSVSSDGKTNVAQRINQYVEVMQSVEQFEKDCNGMSGGAFTKN